MTIIRKMKKSEIFSVHSRFAGLCGALALIFALSLSSCDVGLGEKIDTSVPTVSITEPASSSSVSGDFVIKGSANDDKSLDKVVLTIKNTVTGEETVQTTKITGKDWSIVLDKMNFEDGTYSVDVVAYDGAGRVSGMASRVFDVDNTPPVFCLAKPNSISINDPAAYGRDVTIKGEIADDHAIKQMQVRVFKYDSATGQASEINLPHPIFTGFETAGGTEVVIAKYFSSASEATGDNVKLYENYKAMYLGAQFGDTVSLYVFPYLTDAAGNVSDKCYIQSSLKQLVKEALGVETTCDSLQTAQLKKILNGSYNHNPTDFNESQIDIMLEILDGTFDQNGLSKNYNYFASLPVDATAEQISSSATAGVAPLAMSVNANNSPMYEFGGYVKENGKDFSQVTSGGTMSIKVTAGLDGNAIQVNTIRVYLWECDGNLKLKNSDPDLSGKDVAVIKELPYGDSHFAKATYNSVDDFKVTGPDPANTDLQKEIKDFDSNQKVTTATYKIKLPDSLPAANHYVLTAIGKDEKENNLFSTATYAFMVATSGDAPKIEYDGQFYVNSAAIDADKASSVGYKAKIKFIDRSGTDKKGTLTAAGNYIEVTRVLYEEYINAVDRLPDSPKDGFETIKYTGETDAYYVAPYKIDGSNGNYSIDVPLNVFDLSPDVENYTVALYITAKNTGAASSEKYIIWADNAAPAVAVNAPARTQEQSESDPIYIFENNKNVTKVGTTSISYNYKMSGTWSDFGGSGTSQIWYRWDDADTTVSAPTSVTWNSASGTAVDGKTYYKMDGYGLYLADTEIEAGKTLDSTHAWFTASVGAGWTSIAGAPQGANKSKAANWSKVLDDVKDSRGKKLSLVALDQTGNLSGVTTVSGVTFDFAPPAITHQEFIDYYNADDSLSFNVDASDASGINSFEVIAKKWNATLATPAYETVPNGENGYSLAVSDVTGATTPTKRAAITLTPGTSDGKWRFEVSATDTANRTSEDSFEFTVDTVIPAVKEYDDGREIVIGTKAATQASWHNSKTLTLKGKFLDATSGLNKVVYTITPAGASSALAEKTEDVGANAGLAEFAISSGNFLDGSNTITITGYDKAGNASSADGVEYYVNVDTVKPSLDATNYAVEGGVETALTPGMTIQANNVNGVVIRGTVAETLSGLKSVYLKDLDASVTYKNGDVWEAYDSDHNRLYTEWKAEIAATTLADIADAKEVYVEAEDLAGNITELKALVIQKDVKTPDVAIALPEAGSKINGNVTFEGSAEDDFEVAQVKAYMSLNNEEEIADADKELLKSDGTPYLDGTTSWTIADAPITVVTDGKLYYSDFVGGGLYARNSDGSAATKTVWLKIAAADSAGNKKILPQKYIVDPEYDRPIITFTSSIDLGGMTSSNYALLKAATLKGTIQDDDGLTGLVFEYSTNGGTSYTAITVKSDGSWELPLPDGSYAIKFKVTDAGGQEFVSAINDYLSPIIKDKTNTFDYADTNFYLTVDANAPTYDSIAYSTSAAKKAEGGTYAPEAQVNKMETVGGALKRYIQLEFVNAYDANGIKKITLELLDENGNVDKELGSVEQETEVDGHKKWILTDVDVKGLASKRHTAIVTIYDNLDVASSAEIEIKVDNDAPKVAVTEPDSNAVSGDVTVKGSVVEDSAKKILYALTYDGYVQNSDDSISDKFDGTLPPESSEYKEITSATNGFATSLNWGLEFDGIQFIKDRKVAIKKNGEWVVASDATLKTQEGQSEPAFSPSDPLKIYIWIKALDDLENSNVDVEDFEPHLINFDPLGGRPTFGYGNPEKNGGILGGEIRLYGNADCDDDQGVQSVFLQILEASEHAKYEDGKFTFTPKAADWNFLKSKGYPIYKMEANPTQEWPASGGTDADAVNYGIRANSSGGIWNLTINGNEEFNTTDGSQKELIICGYAYSAKGNRNLPQYRQMYVDSDIPRIENVKLTSASGNRLYTSGMYVRGVWNLELDLRDAGGLDKVFVKTGDTPELAKAAAEAAKKAKDADSGVYDYTDIEGAAFTPSSTDGYKDCHLKLPVSKATGSGKKYIYVLMVDKASTNGQSNSSGGAFAINYDNVAPQIVLDKTKFTKDEFYNKNGFYSFNADVTEEGEGQSGFDRFVVYFTRSVTRDGTSNDYIYNPLVKKNAAGNEIQISGTGVSAKVVEEDGLYWIKETVVTPRDANNLNKITLTSKNANCQKGGLVKIGGCVFVIKDIQEEASSVSVSLDGQVDVSYTEALFAYGCVIDNTKNEQNEDDVKVTEDNYAYNYYKNIKYSDGDPIVESVNKSGAKWTLNAGINSRNIPDGKINVHCVAYDKAGNVANVSVKAATSATAQNDNAYVSNNAPRLAKVTVASDYNYDGTYSADEGRTYTPGDRVNYEGASAWDKAWGQLTLGQDDKPFIAAKGSVQVTPEILGGNGALTWSWTYPDKTSGVDTAATGGDYDTTAPDINHENQTRTANTITLSSSVLSNAKAGNKLYTITISDNTEDGVQDALINLYMKNDVNDGEKPVAKTKRFYWKSLTNNSVYGSSGAESPADLQGHIELETTGETADGDDTATTYTNPKVSGKIVLKGTAFDNAGIGKINIMIPGFGESVASGVTVAEYNWTTDSTTGELRVAGWNNTESGSLATDGYHFVLDTASEKFTNAGHFINWTMELDTEKAKFGDSNLPAKDTVNFVLIVCDKNDTWSDTTNGETAVYATEEQAQKGKYYSEERFAEADADDEDFKFVKAEYSSDEFVGTNDEIIETAAPIAGSDVNKYTVTSVSPVYMMDIVPYITRVKTGLSAVSETNGVTDRSSLGAYPVYVYTNSTSATNNQIDNTTAVTDANAETVKIYGFNLAGAMYGTTDIGSGTKYKAAEEGSYGTGYVELKSNKISSGNFELTVNDVATINNSNNNNARGSYSKKTSAAGGDYDIYKNWYNRQPNNANNNNLTDDVAFDVWQLNNMAAAPMAGNADDPQMKINQSNGKIGFAFSNGSSAFTMPNTTYSWTYWAYDFDRVRYVDLNYDPQGYAWAAAVGQDTHAGGGDPFFMETTRNRDRGGNGNNAHATNDVTEYAKWKLERICIGSAANNIMQDRIQSPSFANTTEGVYLAYYYVGSSKSEIRFRAGKSASASGGNAFDFFQNDGGSATSTYGTANVQLLAGGTGTANKGAKPYVSLAAIDGGAVTTSGTTTTGGTDDDVVVIVWYDGNAMWYGYLANPLDTKDDGTYKYQGDTKASGWTVNQIFNDGVGEYCQIAVDKAGGVHIAAYDSSNADVWYAYLPTYNGTPTTCKVDSYDATGVYLTLDAALDANGYPAPQIGFYSMASARPKYARWNTAKGSLAAADDISGADSNDSYTGNWEVVNVPTKSAVRKSNVENKVKQNINVGVWKDLTSGKIKNSVPGNSYCIGSATGGTSGTTANNYGDVYGNGTSNAVLSYVYGSDSAAFIETAQRR